MQKSKLTKAMVICLKRTKVLQNMYLREIDPTELIDFIDGPSSQERTWHFLKINGYVANGRGFEIRLTKKGELALKGA